MKQHSVQTETTEIAEENKDNKVWKDNKNDKKKKKENSVLTYSIGDLLSNIKLDN